MFHQEDIQERGSKLMVSKGFCQGRALEYTGRNDVYVNAIVGTEEAGNFWYGDLQTEDFGMLHEIAKELGQPVKIVAGDFNMVIAA